MQNFNIQFSHPWLLLLLIPAVLLTLIPYLRISKRYRRTRNRVTSVVLHLLIMVFSISVLSGMIFAYQVPNDQNEIMLLVDVSDTEQESQKKRDDLIEIILKESSYDNYKVGIVTFGFDQEYAVPLTDDIDSIYKSYQEADLPDTSGTNIAAALTFTKELLEHPQTAKIVLITDGKETDEDATSIIKTVSAQGTKVDVAYVSSEYDGSDVQLIDVELPDYHLMAGEECSIKLTYQSKEDLSDSSVEIKFYDNTNLVESQDVKIKQGTNSVTFTHAFEVQDAESFKETGELHKLKFEITNNDALEVNNTYYSYYYLEIFNNLLIIESTPGESENIVQMLGDEFHPVVVDINSNDLPTTINELLAYDQIILNNISNSDLKSVESENLVGGFDELLETYVSEYGGGLFTVGGSEGGVDNNGNVIAHAYNEDDMYGSLYQKMLPVQAIEYTPPIGVMVVVDISGSMKDTIPWAVDAVSACLDALSERDYIGLMTLDTTYSMVMPLTPRTQDAYIRETIQNLLDLQGRSTNYPKAIERAAQALLTNTRVDKRYVVIVSDFIIGGMSETNSNYTETVNNILTYNSVTFSSICVGDGSDHEMAKNLAQIGGGEYRAPAKDSDMVTMIREFLEQPTVKSINYGKFNPISNNSISPLFRNVEFVLEEDGSKTKKIATTLDGFYGVKVKTNADLILVGEYDVPIYAQWSYGKGKVGSFMCDLNGEWSSNFMKDSAGKQFIKNAINNLMPVERFQQQDMSVEIKEDNYTNRLSIFATLGEGEYISGQIIDSSTGMTLVSLNEVTSLDAKELRQLPIYVTTPLSAETNYNRCEFVLKSSGVYKILLVKYNSDGTETIFETYKSFSYSEEYDSFEEEREIPISESLENIASKGNGVLVSDNEEPWEIFQGFITIFDKSFDPRFLFMILAIILFLLDIAVRKFKFKWPHELYREYKNKKNSK